MLPIGAGNPINFVFLETSPISIYYSHRLITVVFLSVCNESSIIQGTVSEEQKWLQLLRRPGNWLVLPFKPYFSLNNFQ